MTIATRIMPVLLAGAGLAAAASPARAPTMRYAGLSPLSEADMRRIDESGCEFAFNAADSRTLVYAMNGKLMIRTARGVELCRPAEGPLDGFTEGRGSVACGGRTLALRKIGRASSHPEADSTTWPAVLSVTRGPVVRTVRGEAGTAC